MDRHLYERARQGLTDDDAFRAFLGFVRLSYEKIGVMIKDYRFVSDNEALTQFVRLMSMWDVHDPVIYGDILWIVPNDEMKQAVQEMSGKTFSPRDFTWWNIRLDLGKTFKPTTADDYPDEFSLVPTELSGPWGRYLPMTAFLVLHHIYVKMTRGGKLKPFPDLDSFPSRKLWIVGRQPSLN